MPTFLTIKAMVGKNDWVDDVSEAEARKLEVRHTRKPAVAVAASVGGVMAVPG